MLATLALAACQKGEGHSAPVAKEYARDVERICDAERLSGALEQPEEARQMTIAQWLGPAIETEEAREFLAALTQVTGAAKAERLRDEARRVGLDGCALAASWK
jgi:hypothetical protein